MSEIDDYNEYTKKRENRLIPRHEDAIYVGVIASMAFALILFSLELAQIALANSRFADFSSGYRFVLIKIVVVLFFLSTYTNYLQNKERKEKSSSHENK